MKLSEMNLQLSSAELHHCPPGWHWDSRNNRWSGLHLWVIAGGRGQLKIEGESYDLRRGECFVLRTWERHLGSHEPTDPLIVYNCTFEVLDDSGNPLRDGLPPRHARPEFPFFETLMKRLHSTCEELWLRAVLDEIERARASSTGGIEEDYLQRLAPLQEAIRREPGRTWRLQELARTLGCSPNQCIRIFRRCLGVTPMEYVIQTRIDAAKLLLECSSETVSTIAEELGYCDAFAFSRQFTQLTGKSPSAWRQD